MNPDILERLRAARMSVSSTQKNLALSEAYNEIEALRRAVRTYGDKTRMATVEPIFLQQVIDRAMAAA